MSRYLQLHLITFYGPNNLNRDDTGKPKTAVVGGATRLRLSSQSLKRAWRTSEVFGQALSEHLGSRTARFGETVFAHLAGIGTPPAKATEIARTIAEVFGKPKGEADKNPTRIEQLAFISPREQEIALTLADRMASGEKVDLKSEPLLQHADSAADIALFGRMFADKPEFNREAAAQVAHAITTHKCVVEDDYYTAVDDLKRPAEDAGAGFLGDAGFGSGTFYLYICINRDLLRKNLGPDHETMDAAIIRALTTAAATTAPGGKQNSFAAHGIAHYVLAERGTAQPRSLAGAFAKPVVGNDLAEDSVKAMMTYRDSLAKTYGVGDIKASEMHVGGRGTLAGLLDFAAGSGE